MCVAYVKTKMCLWYMLSVVSAVERMRENEDMVGVRYVIVWKGDFQQR